MNKILDFFKGIFTPSKKLSATDRIFADGINKL